MAIQLPVSWPLFLFSIYSSLLFFGHHVVVVVGGTGQYCLSHQQSLLLQLKHTLTFNTTTSKILVHWNQSSDCCSWPGISCDHEGRVTGLKLSNESISGGIDNNSTLFNLAYLQSLDLSLNDLNSTIPSRIGNLTNLSYLNFSHSGFGGQIQKEISCLSRLVTLDLSYNMNFYYYFRAGYTTGWSNLLQIPNWGMLVGNITKLEEVYLDGVNISAPGNEWGMAGLSSSSLPNLRVLSLRHCYLSGPIPRWLAKLKSLSVIQLDGNYDLSSRVPEFFANFSNLTSLSLSDCNLSGTFPKEIFQVQTLRTLDLSYNYLLQVSLPELPMDSHLQSLVISDTNSSGGRLPASIGNLVQLSTLDVSDCHFSGPLPNSISNLTQLVHLDLALNSFNGTLPDSITKLTQLVYLDLRSNNFIGPIPSFHMFRNLAEIHLSDNRFIGPIPSSLFALPSLELIDFSHNRFIGPIPSSLFALPSLELIDLSHNRFIGPIPSSLFALPSLQSIDLSYNHFSGQLLEFPNASSSMLYGIDLSSNKLQGTIPMSIFKLRNLEYLRLSSNEFNITMEPDNLIQGFSNLLELDLSYNDLLLFVGSSSDNNSNFSYFPRLGRLYLSSCKLGEFPDLIKNLSLLWDLDLSNNQIHGEIPSWVWKVGSLNLSRNQLVGMQEPYSLDNVGSLDLSFNLFQGKIPTLPPNADHIDLSSNNFTSSIPSDIGLYLSRTSYLFLSNNGLTGVIPESICNASYLRVLDLSNNTLNGKIPRCIIAMNQTIGVILRGNNLTGPIPDAFPFDCQLSTLDVNGNLLTGRIPKSLSNCGALELLNLGNNQMVDTFPLVLKNISTLRVLVLRSNKFYGSITCSENIGDWPEIQIINVASNSFSGQLPSQCLSKWNSMVSTYYDELHLQSAATWSNDTMQDAVRVTNKGLEMDLVKIPKGFTLIDFSKNNFQGKIPRQLGQLKALIALNLSNNALSGQIPSSFGNLKQLESLDLSRNRLNGEIPASLSNLNFLSVLNLSYNQLVGRIPKGNQIQTFSADCFQGNEGLWGPPLTPYSRNNVPETPHETKHSNSGSEIKWDLIGVEVGFVVGFGTVIGPLVFSTRWRKRYFDLVEDAAFRVLPHLLLRKWLAWKMGIRN